MRSSDEFRSTVRLGVRAGRPTVVVHAAPALAAGATKVGFVVSKAVGNAVNRNLVKRRLRHLVRSELARAALDRALPESSRRGMSVVVRALPAAASHPHALAKDLSSAWTSAARRLAESVGTESSRVPR